MLNCEGRMKSSDFYHMLGRSVHKKSGKPFKSGIKIAIPVGIVDHPKRSGKFAFIFDFKGIKLNHVNLDYVTKIIKNGDYVSCEQCELLDIGCCS